MMELDPSKKGLDPLKIHPFFENKGLKIKFSSFVRKEAGSVFEEAISLELLTLGSIISNGV